jgi:hypothetical protein
MDALPIHSLTVVDDKAVVADGTRSPATRIRANTARKLLLTSCLQRMVLVSDELELRPFHELFSGLFVPYRFRTVSS